MQKYEAIICNPDLDTRMRLKQVTSSVHDFGKVLQVGSLREALDRLKSQDRCDVIFISYHFETPEVVNFIKDAKTSSQGQDSAYVLVLKNVDQESSTVAKNVMIGADGLLFEPYSVDQLVEITKLAARVKKERARAREEAAIKFLITDVMNQIDLIAYLKASGCEVGVSYKKFKEMCAVFRTLEGDAQQMYYDLAVTMFEESPLPKKIFQRKKYGGASSRVKRKMEEKLLAELGDRSTPPDETPKS